MSVAEAIEVKAVGRNRSRILLHQVHRPDNAVPELSIVVPTPTEGDAIIMLLASLRETSQHLAVEILVVNDGDEEALQRVALLARQLSTQTCDIRVIHMQRPGEQPQSMATAAMLGIERARSHYVAVVDVDVPHPLAHLIRLYQAATLHNADVVMATGNVGGDGPNGVGARRHVMYQRGMKTLAKLLFPEHLRRVADPFGGCFLFRRALLDGLELRTTGDHLALDVLTQTPWITLVELPGAAPEDGGGTSAVDRRRAVATMRQFGTLARVVPLAALVWKIALIWLLGGLVSLLPFMGVLSLRRSPWLGVLAALETLLLCVALGEELNARHALNVVSLLKRWVVGHGQWLAPTGAYACTTFFLSSVLHNWIIAVGVAPAISLAVRLVLDPPGAPRRVLVTNAAQTADETLLIGREDTARQPVLALMTTSAFLAGAVAISLAQLGPVVAIVALVLGAAGLMQFSIDRSKAITIVLALATAIASVDYATWRVQMTNWTAWFISVPLLLAEALGMVHTLGLQWTLWPRKAPRVRHAENPTHRPIYIFIPTVNEGADVLVPTIRAAKRARTTYLNKHPHGHVEIVICNDGRVANAPNWHEPEDVARRLGVTCITRTVGGGAKAGNLEHARQAVGATGNALIVIFDADQIAHPDFLLRTVRPFSDPEIGWVQTGQYYSNTDNPVARWAHDQQALFYELLCPGKAAHNAAFICGTNVMIRAAALDEIGGMPQDSVTEDFAASIRLHPHWRSVYLSDVLAQGLGPMDLGAYFKQQRRWAIGTLSMLRTQWRAIFLPRKHGLRFVQRIQYALACTHYLSGVRDLIYIIAPLLYVAFGLSAVHGARLETFLWHFLPYWCVSMSAFMYAAWKKTGWRGVVIGFASFPVLIGAALSVLCKRDVTFAVTSKRRANRVSVAVVMPHVLAFAATLTALIWNWRRHDLLQGTAFFVQMWLLYITVMLGLSLWLATHDMLYQRSWRLEIGHSWLRMRQLGRKAHMRAAVVIPSVAALVCLFALTADGGLYATTLAPTNPDVLIAHQAPYLGIAGDTSVLATHIPELGQQADIHFGIVGRSQNVAEHFDTRNLGAAGAVPWITLQFGHYQADGTPSLDASPAAIANGVHDGDIRRLAGEIRQYGKPVLLTILPNVDRNWSVSSAVANGGIPADSARAWAHVHALFHEAGATNVSWVWAPKDPAHDELFAPPDALYDDVLVNVTYNPIGISDEPAIIEDVAGHHPDKPVLVETTSVHADANETAWLEQLTNVVTSNHAILGLIYFDGTPTQQIQTHAQLPTVDTSLLQWAHHTDSVMVFASPDKPTSSASLSAVPPQVSNR